MRARALLVVICFVVGLGLFACLRPLELLFTVLQVKLSFDGISSHYRNIDGYRIHYFEGGSGPTMVLIHGLGSRAEDWAKLMPQLVQGGRHVYAIDMLGYGRSRDPAMLRIPLRRKRASWRSSSQHRILHRLIWADGWRFAWLSMNRSG